MVQIIIQEKNLKELTDNLIIFCDEDKNLLSQAQLIDSKLDTKISTFLSFAEFSAKQGEFTKLNILENNSLKNIYIVSIGKLEEVTLKEIQETAIMLNKLFEKDSIQVATLIGEDNIPTGILQEFINSIIYDNYEFTEWKSDSKNKKLLELSVQVDNKFLDEFEEKTSDFEKINNAIKLSRDLVNRPGNVVTPDYLANEAKELKKFGVKIEILDEKKLEKLGLNLLINVGKGSENLPMLVIMKYTGAGKGAPGHALVGKGITFDTGGYSLKPSSAMSDMKSDMAGAAATLGTIRALAETKSPVNVIGVMACAENMISSKAVKVSDIVKSYNGLTVEINNTDAEGRLVLADAISYVIKNYDVDEVIDIATLTGACVMALGAEHAGVMGYSQTIIDELTKAGTQTNETLWQLPMGKKYAKLLKSDVADVSNISSARPAGATTAGEFLYKFTENKPWAHIDIAGVAFSESMGISIYGIKGATGFGVRLLTEYYRRKVN